MPWQSEDGVHRDKAVGRLQPMFLNKGGLLATSICDREIYDTGQRAEVKGQTLSKVSSSFSVRFHVLSSTQQQHKALEDENDSIMAHRNDCWGQIS